MRLLALDIDGTILTGAAMEATADRGIVLALVTGRLLHGLPEKLLALRVIRYVITSNGAVTTISARLTAVTQACTTTANTLGEGFSK